MLAKAELREMARRGWPIIIIDPSAYWMGADPKWDKGAGTIDRPKLVTRFDPKAAVQLYVPIHPWVAGQRAGQPDGGGVEARESGGLFR